MPFRVEIGAQCQSCLFWILEMDELVLVTYIWRCINIDISVMCVLVYCIQVDYF